MLASRYVGSFRRLSRRNPLDDSSTPRTTPTSMPAPATSHTPAPGRVTPLKHDHSNYIVSYFDQQSYMRSIQRPNPVPPSNPAGPLARWLASAVAGRRSSGATIHNRREPPRHHTDQQDVTASSPGPRLSTTFKLPAKLKSSIGTTTNWKPHPPDYQRPSPDGLSYYTF